MNKVFRTNYLPLCLGILLTLTIPLTNLFGTTHVIQFGGGFGFQYSPSSLNVAVGDTIQWQGSFSLHPMSSTTIPVGAASWQVISGTVYDYPVVVAGSYNYQCDVHFGIGMTGSFVATESPTIDAPALLFPSNSSRGIQINPTLMWRSVATATNYHIQISATSDFFSMVHEDSLLADTSKQISGLSYNTNYYWRVRSKNLSAVSIWSSVFNFSTVLQPTSHTILFGGLLGLQYSPNNIEVIIGDTIRWQGDFLLHPMSSTTIPPTASSWHVTSGTSFDYTLINAGVYNYICDFHFISGMTGSFVAVDYSALTTTNLIYPSNGSSGTPIDPIIIWRRINNATKYHIQISTTPDFLNIVKEDTSITDTSKQIPGLANNTAHYWRVRGRNILTVSNWSVVWNFKTIKNIPAAPQLLYPDSGSTNQPTIISLKWNIAADADSYQVQISTDSLFNTINKDFIIKDTNSIVSDLAGDSTYFWRVRSKNEAGFSSWSSYWKFTTSASVTSISVSVSEQWNIVSVPLLIEDLRKNALFPTATSSAFYYSSGYNTADSLKKGKGYWLKFDSPQSIALSGNAIVEDTIPVSTGWNLIGSISSTIPVTSISSIPPGIVTSTFFTYNGAGYQEADSIESGKGYWVKSDTSGSLVLSSINPGSLSSRIVISNTSELPPLPPFENEIKFQVPQEFSLEPAYPNPFNPITKIEYQLPEESKVTLKVFNMLGQVIATLYDDNQAAGFKSVEWNAEGVASGIYFYRLDATSNAYSGKSFTQIRKMILMK